ncbi:MAG: dTDP-4-dehydrorhamnose reductase [Bacteroidales bacterium]|jgi:dTDP-4-dehydrorhamnose reductase|nr:dTDP-4-dehydrorhamnose reductase [Bacteroidales bacterium]HOI31751.1 dTDP-4-dehydrorhamnose reductase [Bacteroidales bacterium]
MNILVTGSNGQLGNEFQKIAQTDRKHVWYFTDVEDLDITNPTQLKHYINAENIEVCINCAAYTAVDKAEDEPEKAQLLNARAPAFLAEACKSADSLLVHFSTDYVFSGRHFKPYLEDDPVEPASSYAQSKADGERNIMLSGANFMIIRTSWLYSKTGNNFLKTMIRLGKEKESINVVADQVGTPTYAFDLAATILLMVENYNENSINQIYHYSNEGAISWYDFAKAIMDLEKLDCKVIPIESKDYPVKTVRPFYSVMNKARIKSTFNITVPYWRDSLKKCLEELNEHK